MIAQEIIQTCSNPHVANAALASIGGDFARRFARDAAKRNMATGALAADLVRNFSTCAAESEWRGVAEAARGADQPILSGLQYILERGLESDSDEDDSEPEKRWSASLRSLAWCEDWRH
jgi:hypothetical protein